MLKNFLPELKNTTIQHHIKSSYVLSKRNYIPYAIKHIKDRFKYDCMKDTTECGDINLAEYSAGTLSSEELARQVEDGFRFVMCCTAKSGAE